MPEDPADIEIVPLLFKDVVALPPATVTVPFEFNVVPPPVNVVEPIVHPPIDPDVAVTDPDNDKLPDVDKLKPLVCVPPLYVAMPPDALILMCCPLVGPTNIVELELFISKLVPCKNVDPRVQPPIVPEFAFITPFVDTLNGADA